MPDRTDAACAREAWVYVEARRFSQLIDAIAARGEPTSEYLATGGPVGVASSVQPNAAGHYTAAAELLVTQPAWDTATGSSLRAPRDGALGDLDAQRLVAAFASSNTEALRLIRHARNLDFVGFSLPRRVRYAPIHQLPGCSPPRP